MDWTEFLSMGGYGFYVWCAYLLALAALGGEVVLLLCRQKALAKYSGLAVRK